MGHLKLKCVDLNQEVVTYPIVESDLPTLSFISALTGDVTAIGPGTVPATLSFTGVTAGTYGDIDHIPLITVDAKGRITSAIQVPIHGGGTASRNVISFGDTVTTSNVMTDVIDLSLDVLPFESWTLTMILGVESPANGTAFQFTGPAGSIQLLIGFTGRSSFDSYISEIKTSFGSGSAAFTPVLQGGINPVTASLSIINGANAGKVQLQFASNTDGDTSTILAGSFMDAQEVSITTTFLLEDDIVTLILSDDGKFLIAR